MKYILIGILFWLTPRMVFADEAPHKMEDLLQRTQLIVHGKITSNTQLTATINVLEVLFNYRTGIKQGDYLKIQNDFNVVCPVDIPLEYAQQKKEAVFFLSFFKNKWYITMGDVAFFRGGKAHLQFVEEGYEYAGTAEEWKSDLKGYYHHFKRNEQKELRPLFEQKKWPKEKSLSPLAQLQYKSYYKDHFRTLADHSRLKPLEQLDYMEEEVFQTLATAEGVKVPISYEKMLEIGETISSEALLKYPELAANQIEGYVYYSLSFREDGTIAEIKIERPVYGKLHDAIREYYMRYPKWTPAVGKNGKPIRFKQRLQLRFQPTTGKEH